MVTEDLRLGSVDDPSYGFSRVSGVEIDRDGSLFVGEFLAGEIRVFDSAGALLRTIGRKGQGPGELLQFPQWGVVGDTVWMADFRLRRITLFDRAGSLLSTGTWQGVTVLNGTSGSASVIGPRSMRTDGLFWSDITNIAAPPGGVPAKAVNRLPRVLFAPSGEVVDTVGWDTRRPSGRTPWERVYVGSGLYVVPGPPDGNLPRLVSPTGEWHVEQTAARADTVSSFVVSRIDLWGDTAVSRKYQYLPRPYSDVVLDSIAMRWVQLVSSAGGAEADAAFRVVRDAMDFPEFQLPVLEGIAGSDGSLWLRREDTGGPSARWLLIAHDGTAKGQVEVSHRSKVWCVGETRFVVSEEDELDIPWVVRFRIAG